MTQPYTPDPVCPKCDTTLYRHTMHITGDVENWTIPAAAWVYNERADHLAIKCPVCGYVLVMAPANPRAAGGEPPPVPEPPLPVEIAPSWRGTVSMVSALEASAKGGKS